MATHYVDSAAAGTNAGTSWTDAWTSLSSASGVTVGTIELAMLILGYRKVAEPLMTVPPAPAAPPFAEPMPPPTADVDEIMAHLAPPRR